MRKRISLSLIVCLFVYSFFTVSAFAEDDGSECKEGFTKKVVDQTLATASALGNLFSSSNSMAAKLDSLYKKGVEKLSETKPKSSQMMIVVVPNVRLKDYGQSQVCQTKLRQTTQNPLNFTPPDFKDAKQFSSWFADFSKGNGEQGERLYKLCPGQCSPAYRVIFSNPKEPIKTAVEVVCGHARDKSDNQYKMTLELVESCQRVDTN